MTKPDIAEHDWGPDWHVTSYPIAHARANLTSYREVLMSAIVDEIGPALIWRWYGYTRTQGYLAVKVTSPEQAARVDAIVMRYLLVGE